MMATPRGQERVHLFRALSSRWADPVGRKALRRDARYAVLLLAYVAVISLVLIFAR